MRLVRASVWCVHFGIPSIVHVGSFSHLDAFPFEDLIIVCYRLHLSHYLYGHLLQI